MPTENPLTFLLSQTPSQQILELTSCLLPSAVKNPKSKNDSLLLHLPGGYVSGGRVQSDLAVCRGLGDYRFNKSSIEDRGDAGPLL